MKFYTLRTSLDVVAHTALQRDAARMISFTNLKKNKMREKEREREREREREGGREKITASRKMANSPTRITRIAVKRVIGTNGLRMTMIRWLYNVLAVVVPLVEGYNCLSR